MRKTSYLQSADADFSRQLTTFQQAITPYVTLFGLAPEQVTAQSKDADAFAFALAMQEAASNHSQQWTAWKDLLRDGGDGGAGAPAAPVFPTPVAAVLPGIEARFRALVKLIKAHPAYNEGIGQILGIEGSALPGADYGVMKPVLRLELSGGLVLCRWGWQGHAAHLDMLELQVDRGDGKGFVLLAFDTTPDYLDTTPLPATPTKWTYKAIFRVGDQRVGQWSDEVSIVVGG